MFVNRLNLTLTLKISGKSHVVEAGNIKNFAIRIEPYGFAAQADFWLVSQKSESEDKLYASFVKNDIIEVGVKLDRTFDKVGSSTDPIQLTGLVEEKTLSERAFPGLSGAPVLHRHYTISFRDRAAVLWSQHRPIEVYADQTLKKVIDDHKPKALKLKHDWKASTTKRAVLSLGMGADPDGSTFYDYLFWLSEREGTGLFLDTKTEQYTLSDKKPAAKKTLPLPEDDVEIVEIRFPPTPRHLVKVLNGYSEAGTKSKEVANKQGFGNVRQERLIIAPIANDLTTRTKAEKTALRIPEANLFVEFGRFPSVTIRPNLVYDFTDGWSDRVFARKGKYRMRWLEIIGHAENQGATDDTDDDSNAFELDVRCLLEPKASTAFTRPAYRRPHWPFFVEGKVVSGVGKKAELTYQANKDKTTSLDFYKVLIPLWKRTIIAPFNPGFVSGHFYFPAYRDERVLLALEHDGAWIKRYLDWRPGARLPAEGQGNHLLLGKQEEDQTSIRHDYASAKPVLTIERTMKKDTQIITVSEGTIRMETKEDD